ncbi:piggyBac transposable element-derived protein 4-like [Anthonomus grandis grandis]|uniref:piggyBac transposable element-derived protein 4-like n=1 Tax=Anthonomus grandis grandis TaxID=2921223 RepID=UPI002166A2B1|nr:piggyBac transposable element-derived protein 4-like [Anthonomus grandis grandis]
MKRGEMEWFTSNSDLSVIKWKDKRSVFLLSNFHDPRDMLEVNRKEKDGSITKVPCPKALADYNANMNFVDKFDQNLSYYKIDRKSHKWWHRIFFFFLDAAVVNAFVLYKGLQLPPLSMKDFRRSIIEGLVAEALVARKRSASSFETIAIKKNKPYVSEEVRFEGSTHQPERGTRRRCANCSTKKNQVRTEWVCSVCNVPLCLTKNKTCFQDFHRNK